MTDAETILKMIEAVDPADTAKLDQIDNLVWGFIGTSYNGSNIQWDRQWHPYYTRSRDALKAIRPEGMSFIEIHTAPDGEATCEMGLGWDDEFGRALHEITTTTFNGFIKTEELAELHAIIQAIAYERASSST